MRPIARNVLPRAAWSLALTMIAASSLAAQVRLVLPENSVIIVQTTSALQSNTVRVGQTFETVVVDSLGLDNYTAIPSNSHIRGNVTYVQPATRSQSGVIQVTFDRLTIPDGTVYPIVAHLTSTDSAERRQIDQDPNARVVLVGGRGGIGGIIAGASSSRSSTSGILGALGTLLSQGQDVAVPSGTPLAVQLDRQVVLRGRGRQRQADDYTIYTAADRIRAAQQALSSQNYYRGAINGVLNDATQRALFQFQSDRGLNATGNLDFRTAQALGLSLGTGTTPVGGALTAEEAATLRRNAQVLLGRERSDLSISTLGRLSTSRAYNDGDVELWFALSGFADNAELYEQLVRGTTNTSDATISAGRALLTAARRVDSAMQSARPSYP
ncbi:MAG: peptidoglycan-binding domain-containing protein, partial [Gemmatimonadales bacterium]